ncbi:MAG: HTTM domain-containing protein [Bacteroidota bacterium]
MNVLKFLDKDYLNEEIDNSALVLFRISFGFLIAAEGFGAILTGWVHETFVEPDFTFSFIGLEWLQPLPGYGMYAYFAVMGSFGLAVMLGWKYRFSTIAYLVLWCGVYYMQKSHYNNHYYLLIHLLALMSIVPAHKYLSLDVKRNPKLKSMTCPRWAYVIFIVLLWIVYTYAGFSKIYDDWLEALPIKLWFSGKRNFLLIGDLLQQNWLHTMVVYGGILFDILCIPMLLWKRTRTLAFVMSLFFHLFNSAVFHIGIFPYMMIGATAFFFKPETVGRIFFKRNAQSLQRHAKPGGKINPLVYYLFIAFFISHILLPVRYHMYPGNVHWTEEGHRLAWKMMLRTKSGYFRLQIVNPQDKSETVINPRDYVSRNQYRKMSTRPDMIWQFIQRIKAEWKSKGIKDIEIYVISRCSLNGSKPQALIDPKYDMAKAEWNRFKHSEWILPFQDESPNEKM